MKKNNRRKKIIGISVILLLLVGVIHVGMLIYVRYFFHLAPCEEGYVTEQLSSGGNYKVKEFTVDCGAVSDVETIFEVKNLVSKENQQILNLKGEVVDECKPYWVDTRSLLIECISKRSIQIHDFKEQFGDVKINFRLPDSFFMYDHSKPGQGIENIK